MAISKESFSASTDGRRILLANTATTIHTAAATGTLDDIHLNIVNTSAVRVRATIQFGGTNTEDVWEVDIEPDGQGLTWIVRGDHLTNGVLLRALGATTNVLSAGGWVVRDTGSA